MLFTPTGIELIHRNLLRKTSVNPKKPIPLWLRPLWMFLLSLAFTPSLATAGGKEDAASSAEDHQRIQVTATKAEQAEWQVTIPAQGEIHPWEVAIASAKTTGIVATEINVLAGDSVQKGQVLARFDDRLLKAELAQQKANVALAQANLELALTNLTRMEKLKQNKTVSEQDYDATATQAAAAKATRDQATAILNIAKIKLDDATVLAPDDGKILQRSIELGEVPQAGQSLFRVLRQHKLEWLAEVDTRDFAELAVNMPAHITLPDSEQVLTGKVRSISPQLNPGSRLAIVRVTLDGSPQVPVNSYVKGDILVGTKTAVIAPAESLVVKDGKTWMFRILQNNSVEQVPVKIGRRQHDEVEIIAGIGAGDTLVVDGAGFLNDGDVVTADLLQTAGVEQ